MVTIRYFKKKKVNEDETEENQVSEPVVDDSVVQGYSEKNASLSKEISTLNTEKSAVDADLNKKISDIVSKISGIDVSDESAEKEVNLKKVIELRKELVGLKEKVIDNNYKYTTAIYQRNKEIIENEKKIVEAGGEPQTQTNESFKKTFGRKLYEASTNRTDEMFTMISLAFDSVDGLSYTPNDTKKRTMARNLIAFINKNGGWGSDGEYHGDEFNDEVKRVLNAGQTSLSMKEKERFIDELDDQLKNNVMFSYIFKENN